MLDRFLSPRSTTRATPSLRARKLAVEPLESRTMLDAGPLVINEFMAVNGTSLADENGDRSDWIEIYNPTNQTVNLDGWYLTDDAGHLMQWRFPSASLLPNRYLTVFASGKNRTDPRYRLHTNFRLDGDGEYLALVRPDGVTVSHEYAPAFPAQTSDVSYGIGSDATTFSVPDDDVLRYRVPAAADAGAETAWMFPEFDDSAWPAFSKTSGILITEAGTEDPDYVEIQNVSDHPIDTEGWVVAANVGSTGRVNNAHTTYWQLPTVIGAGQVLYQDDDPESPEYYWGDAISWRTAGYGWVMIVDDFGNVADFVVWGYPAEQFASMDVTINGHQITSGDWWNGDSAAAAGTDANSLQRRGDSDHDSAADWAFVGPLSPLEENAGLLTPFTTDVATGFGFDVGETGLGGTFMIDVAEPMHGQNASLWTRIPFEVDNPALLDAMQLHVQYNDGFVAYLNGVEVARRNAPDVVGWNSAATGVQGVDESQQTEEFDLAEYLDQLRPGRNVLAVHGLNTAANDANFRMVADLTRLGKQFFTDPTPAAANGAGSLGIVADTAFSVDRGFFDQPFEVAVTTDTPGATIRYTLDGSLPTEENGHDYTGPLVIDRTTTLRAMAIKPGHVPTNVDSQTYLFLDDVKTQTRPPGYPTATEDARYQLDYDVDPRVVDDPRYADEFISGLTAIPSVSLVMDVDDLFGRSRGIYANAIQSGLAWERATSVEYLDPAGGDQFQINSAIRIQGAYSRYPQESIKHAFRLIFKAPYGPTKLNYKVFDDSPVDKFDQLILRMSTHDSWHVHQNPWRADATYAADQWHRYTQLAMGNLSGHSKHVHLYLNGLYWGLYEIEERPNASFAASYLGGESEDYDAINGGGLRDGTMAAWNEMYRIANGQGPHGSLANAAAYEDLKRYLDVGSFADYLIANIYSGNMDWPGKNYYAVRKREPGAGFHFVSWDSEASFWKSWGGDPPAADASVWNGLNYPFFNNSTHGAGYLYNRLKYNAEFRMLMADRLHRHFANGGVLTPQNAAAMYQQQLDKVHEALVPESARWGDAWRPSQPYTRDAELAANVAWLFGQFFPVRGDNVLKYFDEDGMVPDVEAPSYNQHGGSVAVDFELTVDAAEGAIYYTLDGSDPRVSGGGFSPRALVYEGEPIRLDESTHVNARAFHGDEWSALNEATFLVDRPSPLAITEINYHPYDPTAEELARQPPGAAPFQTDDFEFVELQNTGGEPLDLTGVQFTDGIEFRFAEGTTLAAGAYVVVASDLDAFAARYGDGIDVAGVFTGELQDGGEAIRLSTQFDEVIASFTYDDANRWPGRADGKGAALELIDPAAMPGDGELRAAYLGDGDNWHSSVAYGGTPGAEPAADPGIAINEVLTHTDAPLLDAIELLNTTGDEIDLGGWYLSDSWGWTTDRLGGNYRKFRVPDGTVIAPGGYLVFDERDFNPNGLWNPEAGERADWEFALDGAAGDDVWLMEADAAGRLTRFADHVDFPAAASGESFGRYPNATGDLAPMQQRTLGEPNAEPRVGPIVISEVMYHPPAGGDEFIELLNPTGTSVSLFDPARPDNTWRIGGVDFQFPIDVVMPPGGVVVVVPTAPDAFREKYSVTADVQVFGPYAGALNNAGERLRLLRPDEPTLDVVPVVPYVIVDEADYRPDGDWPLEADGGGQSLERVDAALWGHYPNAWQAADPTPGDALLSAGPQVTGRWAFYNNSAHDGREPAANPQDDDAIAVDKTPLFDGQTASLANYTNYASGINGILVDLAGLPDGVTPGVGDFAFRIGNDNHPANWPTAPEPTVTVRPGDGPDGADRVTITWEDYAIRNRWLQVTVLSGRLGLAQGDVFYFGNAVAEAGNSAPDAQVTATDLLLARNNPRNFLTPAAVDFAFDYNRDQRVNATDVLLARNNQTNFLTALRLIEPPAR